MMLSTLIFGEHSLYFFNAPSQPNASREYTNDVLLGLDGKADRAILASASNMLFCCVL